ncbi:MAG: DUF362 domain-containing protein, partial [Christensenellaceae bacterium]|nr:DUF362 domain-containing protein [Christensenellaceae bacterium]
MEKVALAVCREYGRDAVEAAVDKAVGAIGGFAAFVKKGQKVLIKPNLMRKSHPDQAAVTHPELIRAVVKRCVELGAEVLVAESPGGAYNAAAMRGIYDATGAGQAICEAGARWDEDCLEDVALLPEGKSVKELRVIAPALWADVIIDLPKLKSHTLAVYTGAVKNLYGLVPGFEKAELHFRYPSIEGFSQMILDICQRFKPVLSIIDGIVAMEGEGPGSGEPRPLGAVVASGCPYSADQMAASLVGYAPEEIPMLRMAKEQGLYDGQLEVLGDDPKEVAISDFVRASVSGNHLLKGKVPAFMQSPLEKWFALKPRVDREKCIGCGICARTCPP